VRIEAQTELSLSASVKGCRCVWDVAEQVYKPSCESEIDQPLLYTPTHPNRHSSIQTSSSLPLRLISIRTSLPRSNSPEGHCTNQIQSLAHHARLPCRTSHRGRHGELPQFPAHGALLERRLTLPPQPQVLRNIKLIAEEDGESGRVVCSAEKVRNDALLLLVFSFQSTIERDPTSTASSWSNRSLSTSTATAWLQNTLEIRTENHQSPVISWLVSSHARAFSCS
jgi:hypothetical protein